MKTNLILTSFVAVLVIGLNFPGLADGLLAPLHVTAATIALFVPLVGYQYYLFLSREREPECPVPAPAVREEPAQPKAVLPDFPEGTDIKGTIEILLDAYRILPAQGRVPEQSDGQRLLDELDTFRQSYLWCCRMNETYGERWADLFQGASLPLHDKDLPAMRSLLAEVAVQTADFCRYRAGDINVTDRMLVNPRSLLLGIPLDKAGAMPLSDNPFEMPKEVLALNGLFRHDGITLFKACLHGFIQDNPSSN